MTGKRCVRADQLFCNCWFAKIAQIGRQIESLMCVRANNFPKLCFCAGWKHFSIPFRCDHTHYDRGRWHVVADQMSLLVFQLPVSSAQKGAIIARLQDAEGSYEANSHLHVAHGVVSIRRWGPSISPPYQMRQAKFVRRKWSNPLRARRQYNLKEERTTLRHRWLVAANDVGALSLNYHSGVRMCVWHSLLSFFFFRRVTRKNGRHLWFFWVLLFLLPPRASPFDLEWAKWWGEGEPHHFPPPNAPESQMVKLFDLSR